MTTITGALSLIDALGPAVGRAAPSTAAGESGFDAVLARVLEQPERSHSPSVEARSSRPDERSQAPGHDGPDGAGPVEGAHLDDPSLDDRRAESSAEPSVPSDGTATEVVRDAGMPRSEVGALGPAEPNEVDPAEPTVAAVMPPPVVTQLVTTGMQLSPSLPGVAEAAAVAPVVGAVVSADPSTVMPSTVMPSTVMPSTAVSPARVGVVSGGSTESATGTALIPAIGASLGIPAGAGQDQTTDVVPTLAMVHGSAEPATAPVVAMPDAAQDGAGQASTPSLPSVPVGEVGGAPAVEVVPSVPVGEVGGAPVAEVVPSVPGGEAAGAASSAPAAGDGASPASSTGVDILPGAVPASSTSSTTASTTGRASAPGTTGAEQAPQHGPVGTRLRDRFVGTGLGGTMTMDLSDEGLGQLSLRAHQSGDGLHVTLAAGESTTRELLLSQSANLRSELESVGPLGSLDVTDSLSAGGGGRGATGDGRTAWAGDRSGQDDQRLRNDQPGSDTGPHRTAPGPQASTTRSAGSTGLDLLI
jgi:hypothetical protein